MRLFAEKCDFFERINFFGVRNSISGPIAQNLLKPVIFQVFWAPFSSILHFFTKFQFFRAKTVFGAQIHFFAKRCAFLRFGMTFWIIPAPLRKLLRNLSFLWCFGPPFPFFSILGAIFAFFHARSDFFAQK